MATLKRIQAADFNLNSAVSLQLAAGKINLLPKSKLAISKWYEALQACSEDVKANAAHATLFTAVRSIMASLPAKPKTVSSKAVIKSKPVVIKKAPVAKKEEIKKEEVKAASKKEVAADVIDVTGKDEKLPKEKPQKTKKEKVTPLTKEEKLAKLLRAGKVNKKVVTQAKKAGKKQVIETIVQTLEAGGLEGCTKADILATVVAAFDTNPADTMATINTQVPSRLRKAKGYNIQSLKNNNGDKVFIMVPRTSEITK